MTRLLLALLLLPLATGCPSSLSAACPSTSTPVGDFTLNLTLQPSTGQCRVILAADGGPADGDVATVPAPQNATMCAGRDPDSGVDLIYLAVENRTLRQDQLVPAGTFTFITTSTGVSGTVCGCAVDVTETITGIMYPQDGSFQLAPDGGVTPAIAALDGSVKDTLTPSAGSTGCLCNLNVDGGCNLTYQMFGPPR